LTSFCRVGFFHEIIAKITPYFEILVDHWDVYEARASANNFWLTYTCGTIKAALKGNILPLLL